MLNVGAARIVNVMWVVVVVVPDLASAAAFFLDGMVVYGMVPVLAVWCVVWVSIRMGVSRR